MKIITQLDYELLSCIPLYPEEKTRGQIILEIKAKYPNGKYDHLTTSVFDASLLKYTKMFMLIEDKNLPESIFFEDMFDDADCLQSTLEPIDLEWVKAHIGEPIDMEEDSIYEEFITLSKRRKRGGWYKQSVLRLHQ